MINHLLEHILQRVDPILADFYSELGNLSLSIGDEGNEAFAEHGIIPVTTERIIVPVFQPPGYGLMRL